MGPIVSGQRADQGHGLVNSLHCVNGEPFNRFFGCIRFGNHCHAKAQLGRLFQTLLAARRGAHLAGEADLAKGQKALGQGLATQRGGDGQQHRDQVFFGATVTYEDMQGQAKTVTILGIDEADSLKAQVSWISPIARALLKAKVGDVVKLQTPAGIQDIEVVEVSYPPPGSN